MIPSWPTTETTSETCSSTQETRCSASPSSVTLRRVPQSSQNRALSSFRHRRHFMGASPSWLGYRTGRRGESICGRTGEGPGGEKGKTSWGPDYLKKKKKKP